MAGLKLLHLLCFVYWLGGDLGTFYASGFVRRRDLPPAARVMAATVMNGTDVAPRICMPLTLASGLHLAVAGGFVVLPAGTLAATWAGCGAWLALVLLLHHGVAPDWQARLARLDFGGRIVVTGALGLVAAASLLGAWPQPSPWLALKLACFAATVFCGLMIRVHVRPFGPAYARLVQHGADAAGDAAIERALGRARPWVVGIWGLLLVAAFTGLHGWLV